MSGQILGASTTVPGLAGVAFLPNTGGTRVLFVVASMLFVAGLTTLVYGAIAARRNNEA